MKTEHTPILTYKAFEMTDRPGFIDLSIDWDALPFDYKNKLVEEMTGEPMYTPDELYGLKMIIPCYYDSYHKERRTRMTDAFVYFQEIPGDLNANEYEELVKYIQNKDTWIACLCKKIGFDAGNLATISINAQSLV